jgi:hypothetical protein
MLAVYVSIFASSSKSPNIVQFLIFFRLSRFTSYTAGILILHEIVRKALNEHNPSTWEDDMPLVSSCIDVLEYCTNIDRAAGRFKDVLSTYRKIILAEQPGLEARHHQKGQPDKKRQRQKSPIDCLFRLPAGESDLHKAARDLIRLMHQPFGSACSTLKADAESRTLPIQTTLVDWMETSIGPHLEWEWENRKASGKQSSKDSRLVELLSLLGFGNSLEAGFSTLADETH